MTKGNKKGRHSTQKRIRRSNEDMIPILEKHKMEFGCYSYAGDRETMLRIFPSLKQCYKSPEELDKYFSQIPEELFHDEDTIKKYGENIRKIRKEKGTPQQGIAKILSIEDKDATVVIQEANLDEIEKGERKQIDKNILVLLCGIYQKSPEKLMGLKETSIDPLIIYRKDTGIKVNFIIIRLSSEAPELLCAFHVMAGYSVKQMNKIVDCIASCTGIKIFHGRALIDKIDKKITIELRKKLPEEIMKCFGTDDFDSTKLCFMKHENCRFSNIEKCSEDLRDLDVKCLDLLDAYASVVIAGKSMYGYVFKRLTDGGFMSFSR